MSTAESSEIRGGYIVHTPDGWSGRVESVLSTGKAAVVHPRTKRAWFFSLDDLDVIAPRRCANCGGEPGSPTCGSRSHYG